MSYKLFNYKSLNGKINLGIKIGDNHYYFESLFGWQIRLDDILENWFTTDLKIKELVKELDLDKAQNSILDFEKLTIAPLLNSPGVIYGAGANYRDHVEAMSRAMNMKLVLDPKTEGVAPFFFLKPGRSALVSHGAEIKIPDYSTRFDYEVELAVFIGKHVKNISVENALECVAGYSVANDLSARDQLKRENVDKSSPFSYDWLGHKCFTGSCPVGAYLTPASEVADVENLGIRLWVNGEVRQDSNTKNHLYNVSELISYLSSRVDLFPGDIILTGTPAGVGMESHTFLKRGDEIKVGIHGLGTMTNKII